jgi:benzoylformate decarboxylase
MMNVSEYLLQTLEHCGVRCIFGNPGTTEIPLVRLCERRERLKYVVALSEVSAVPMADGYARATRSLGVVNLHVAPGLGNGMGGIYTAGIAKTPLLVLVGGQDRRFLHTRPMLYGPLEQMAGSLCKAVFRLDSVHDAAANVRNAIRAALTPPYRPVALICPPDLLEETVDAVPAPIVAPRLSGLSAEDAERIARLLVQASSPAIVASEDVHWHGAAASLRALAERLDAPVYAAPYTAVLPIDSSSPSYAGYLSPGFQGIGERLASHDLLVFAGGRGMRTTLYSEACLPQRKIWLGDDHEVVPAGDEFEAAHLVDLSHALSAVDGAVSALRRSVPAAPTKWRPVVELPAREARTFHPSRAVAALLDTWPEALIFDEGGLSTSDVRQWMAAKAGEYIINGSGGIGWGLAASVGGAIGCPDRQIVAIIGDGSALYAAEALWSAANQGARVLLVILSNGRYATLNEAASKLTGHDIDLFSIEPPKLDFSGLATLYGWRYQSAEDEDTLARVLAGLHKGVEAPTLLELRFDAAVKPVTASRHF